MSTHVKGTLSIAGRTTPCTELAFFNDQSHAQVAVSLAIPLGTAKTRIALGKKRLRHLLKTQE